MREIFLIVVTYNSAKVIDLFLESLRRQEVHINVIVVDNNSSDNTLDKIYDFRQECIADKRCPLSIDVLSLDDNYFYGGGINKALKYIIQKYNPSKDSVVIVVNPDIVFYKDTLKELVKDIRGGFIYQCTILNRRRRIDNQGFIISDILTSYRVGEGAPADYASPLSDYVNAFSGACFASTLETFLKIGFFDENIDIYCEDTEYSLRALCRKVKIKVLQSCQVLHLESTSIESLEKKWYFLTKNCGYVVYRYFGLTALMKYLFMKIIFSVVMGARFAAAFIKGASGLLADITLNKYSRVKCSKTNGIVYNGSKLLRYQIWQTRRRSY